jgi:hypothetical protein
MSAKSRNALVNWAIGAALIAAPVLAVSAPPAYAISIPISLTDSWSEGSLTNKSGLAPTLSTSGDTTSNDGYVTPISNPKTQALTQGTPVTAYLFVAIPPGTGKADIPITFTLSDGTGGTVTFTDWINYFADAPSDTDSMAWSTSAVSPAYTSGTNNGAPSLVQTETLSDGTQIQITLPYETDWDMAQKITFDYTGGGGGGGGGGDPPTVPEPSPLAVIGTALVGLMLLRWRSSLKNAVASSGDLR